VKLAQQSQSKRKRSLFTMLSSRIVKREEPDERVTRLGFELLREQVAREPSKPRNAHYLLCDIEQYVGMKFYPYGEKERYRRGSGTALTEAYFQEGVDNAMQWWKETRGTASHSAQE
jgi:hypothetical protein